MKIHPLAYVTLSILTALLSPSAFGDAADDIAERIRMSYELQRAGEFEPGYGSKEGTLNFWSSGGLLQETPPGPPEELQESDLYPKHITVIVNGDSAAAMYYAEGTMTAPGGETISNYLTRVMEFYIREDGKWVVRAGHFSPVQGGRGTSQVTP
ncbi:MAG: hypothetical protein E2O61_15700 [Gammaproteobacteria bacterium]|nr:MAG: hypothetical protein E2O61_15700 [Gammaproteobacteria bacterium]